MAIPKKGSRPIVVEGENYRWYIRKKPTYNQLYTVWNGGSSGMTVAVEHADSPGQVLVVDLAHPHPGTDTEIKVAVVPSQVAQFVKQALKEGWMPTQSGGPFRLKSEADETTPAHSFEPT